MRTRLRPLAALAAALLLAAGCASEQGDLGKTVAGNPDAMKRVQDAQTKAVMNNQNIPPAARAGIAQTMEASRAQASRMPRAANP